MQCPELRFTTGNSHTKTKQNTTKELFEVYLQSWTVMSVRSEFSLTSMVLGYY